MTFHPVSLSLPVVTERILLRTWQVRKEGRTPRQSALSCCPVPAG